MPAAFNSSYTPSPSQAVLCTLADLLLQHAPLIPGLLRRDEAYSGCLHGILEAAVEDIDASVVNTQQAGLQIGQALPRGGERISLTVRRVLHTYSLGLRL